MTEIELLKLLSTAKTQDEYDRLVDRYIFKISNKNRNTKHNRQHDMLSTNQMLEIRKREKPYDFSRPWI